MRKSRRVFYSILAAVYPLFFLLHWNGLFSQTYYWALEAIGGTREILPQVTLAFLSSLVLFAVIVLIFELILKVRDAEPRRPLS